MLFGRESPQHPTRLDPVMSLLPSRARAVIIGGGIAGCSIAYHLNKLGWRDVVLLEQGRLSGGTTWHAAGLVGQLRTHPSMTRLIRYSTELYAGLEAETGQATGWKQCGSLTVARTAERMTLLKRVAATARVQGVACELLTPAEAARLYPIMETKDLVGAIWLPGDGKANPADITQALAKGARAGGTRILERTRVSGIIVRDGVARGVRTSAGALEADVVVIAAGQWSRQLGRAVGVTVPLHPCEHMYIVTGRIEGVTPDLPCLRDPDGYIYFKEEVGGLLMGGFEPTAKPWRTEVPDDFEFGLLPDDWDQFEILMQNAVLRVPALEKAEVKRFINGPESFTADNNYILGEAPDVRGLFVAAGFNSMGIASSGGAGKALAEWIVHGNPTLDLWPVDVRRFAAFNGNRAWLKDRVAEVLGLHYKMPWPARELETARPLRRSPLYDRLAAKGAVFGSKMGWERPNVFAPPGESPEVSYSWGRASWFDWHVGEQKAARSAAVMFDMSSFAKLLVQGRDSERELQRLAANDVAVPVGRSVYTGLLNARGGYESDVTIARLGRDEFLILTGTAQATRDAAWIRRNLEGEARATLTDVTSAWSVLALMGPQALAVMARAGATGHEALSFGEVGRIEIGFATLWACRRTYVGEAGFELYVPTEFTAGVYDRLMEAGAAIGIRDAGYYALEAMRLEKGYRAWGRELTPDVTPFEVGLGFAARLDKPLDFIGKAALLETRGRPPRRRCVSLVASDPDAPLLHGGELVLSDGQPVGEITSAAFGAALERPVMLGFVARPDGAVTREWLTSARFSVDVGGIVTPVRVTLEAPFDPANARLKS
jgi:4-methylaminobutanoate oxidase (formaldehyde-forming)